MQLILHAQVNSRSGIYKDSKLPSSFFTPRVRTVSKLFKNTLISINVSSIHYHRLTVYMFLRLVVHHPIFFWFSDFSLFYQTFSLQWNTNSAPCLLRPKTMTTHYYCLPCGYGSLKRCICCQHHC